MVTQFDETGAKPASFPLTNQKNELLARPAQCCIDPQSHPAIRRPGPANARQYDAHSTF